MCGIAGSVNFKLKYSDVTGTMMHRGPDAQNGYLADNVDLFHLRLSILDIANGGQPMHLHDRYTIIFNGEIYNHQELRNRFGLTGETSSDTETLLLLYSKMGPAFLDHLDGMFALAILDRKKKKLFLARDRAGKKPLYIYRDDTKLVFASELNCLRELLPLEMNSDNFYHYTRMGMFYRNLTPYKNVTELTGGSYIITDCTNLKVTEKRWWNIADHYSKRSADTLQESIEKTDDYLHTAIKRRLESSDLEVGCFLSGGIDSGLATAIGSGYNNRLKTFTVAFEGAYNEAPLAKLVAEKYNTDHTEINISFDNLKDNLENILFNYGEPFYDSSAIPSYYVCWEAKKHITVILNGDGADELFAGYRRYVPFAKYDFFKKNSAVKTISGALRKFLPQADTKQSKYNYMYRLLSLASKSDLEIYLSASSDIMEDYESNIIAPEFNYLAPMQKDFGTITGSSLSGLQKLMNMDFDTALFSDLLVKMDIAAMANSLEGRSPFLSKELLEYAPSVNDAYKIKGSTTKYLLRELSKKYLPPELVNQPKRGFEIPLKNWVENELKENIADYVGAAGAMHHQFIKKDFTEKLLNNKIKISAEKRAKILWMIYSMEIWYKKNYLRA